MSGDIQIEPMVGALGAEVRGVDLAGRLSDEQVAALRAAWLEHQVLVFREQSLDPRSLAAAAERFGELETYPFVEPVPEHPKVVPIVKEPGQTMNFGGAWHTDTSYLAEPPSATMLYALEVPERGGDTLFADAYGAFESLSPGMQRLAASLEGVYSPAAVHGSQGVYTRHGDHPMARRESELAESEVVHPIVRTHPETGRRAIYCSLVHTLRLADMTREESLPLLEYLCAQITRAERVTRLRWRAGSVALWDNRCVQHYALNDYPDGRRSMLRVIVKGDRPR